MTLFIGLFLSHLSCIAFGFLLYRWRLRKAGILGKLVANKVDGKLKDAFDLPEQENTDPDLPGRKSRNHYGKFKQGD